MDTEFRDEILRPYLRDGSVNRGINRFSGLPLDVLEKLIFHGFVRLGDWNSCAGVQDLFLPFLIRHPDFTAHGYAVSRERPNPRITIEGVECSVPMTIETIADFAKTFRRADQFRLSPSHAHCWYD